MKGKCFLILFWRLEGGYSEHISLRHLHLLSGIPYRSLATLLKRWFEFGYVSRTLIPRKVGGKLYPESPVYGYRLKQAGLDWLRFMADGPYINTRRLASEIDTWQARPEVKELLEEG